MDTPQRQRREFSPAEQRRIIEESHRPGVSMSDIGRKYGLSSREVYELRRAVREGRLDDEIAPEQRFVPVIVTDEAPPVAPSAAPDAFAMRLRFPAGELAFDARIDPALLDRVLRVLRR